MCRVLLQHLPQDRVAAVEARGQLLHLLLQTPQLQQLAPNGLDLGLHLLQAAGI